MTFTIIWIYVIWVIWKERNKMIFQNKANHFQALSEKGQIIGFFLLKPNNVLIDFEYLFWRNNHLYCLTVFFWWFVLFNGCFLVLLPLFFVVSWFVMLWLFSFLIHLVLGGLFLFVLIYFSFSHFKKNKITNFTKR